MFLPCRSLAPVSEPATPQSSTDEPDRAIVDAVRFDGRDTNSPPQAVQDAHPLVVAIASDGEMIAPNSFESHEMEFATPQRKVTREKDQENNVRGQLDIG